MNNRILGNSGAKVSEVGLGTWQIGGSWGDINDAQALKILRQAVDSGINFFDTADVYGDGRSERLIGEFLKQTNSRVFVATKLGRGSSPGWPENFQAKNVRAHVEASLARLGVDALDLIQLHCIPTEVLREGTIFETLRQLKTEGLVKNFGASVESDEEALICLQQSGLTSLQIIFNIFRQKPISTIFDRAKTQNVGIIARVPLASGLLSGKMSLETKFSATDHRNYNRDGQSFNVGETFAGIPFDKGIELVDNLRTLLPKDMTMSQAALRWILDFDAITTVIPGASSVEQVRANVSASNLSPLSPKLHQALTKFYDQSVVANIRGPY